MIKTRIIIPLFSICLRQALLNYIRICFDTGLYCGSQNSQKTIRTELFSRKNRIIKTYCPQTKRPSPSSNWFCGCCLCCALSNWFYFSHVRMIIKWLAYAYLETCWWFWKIIVVKRMRIPQVNVAKTAHRNSFSMTAKPQEYLFEIAKPQKKCLKTAKPHVKRSKTANRKHITPPQTKGGKLIIDYMN